MPTTDEWVQQQERILTLLEEYPLKNVIPLMKDLGFDATKSQYEQQLLKWNARKNLKSTEWQSALRLYDHYASQHSSEKVRLFIAGAPVNKERIARNRRRYCRGRLQASHITTTSLPLAVTIELRNAEGNWTAVNEGDILDEPLPTDNDQIPAEAVTNLSPGTLATLVFNGEHEAADITNFFRTPFDAITVGVDLDLLDHSIAPAQGSRYSPASAPYPRITSKTVSGFQPNGLFACDPAMQAWTVVDTHEYEASEHSDFERWFSSNVNSLTHLPTAATDDIGKLIRSLPFYQLEFALASHQSVGVGTLTHGGFTSSHRFGRRSLWMSLLDDVARPSLSMHQPSLVTYYNREILLRPLLSLLPGIQSPCVQVDSQDDGLLLRLLMFTFANNLRVSDKECLSWVLDFLGRFRDMRLLLSKLGDARKSYCRAIATGLFQASVDARGVPLVRQLLALNIIDVNSIQCTVGWRQTALECATALQDVQMVHALLQAGADPNKTFGEGGAMEHLFSHYSLPSYSSLVACQIKECLLLRGGEITTSFLMDRLDEPRTRGLAYDLIIEQERKDHRMIAADDTTPLYERWVAGDEQPLAIMKLIHQTCINTHDGRCLDKFPLDARKAVRCESDGGARLRVAASFGYLEVVEELIPHTLARDRRAAAVLTIEAGHWHVASALFNSIGAGGDCVDDALERAFEQLVEAGDIVGFGIGLDWVNQWRPGSSKLRLLSSIIKLGDRAIMMKAQVLFPLSLCPGSTRTYWLSDDLAFLSDAIETCEDELLEFMIANRFIDKAALTECLRSTVLRDNVELCQRMLAHGADPTDERVLEFAMRAKTDVLALLLLGSHVQSTQSTKFSPTQQAKLLQFLLHSVQINLYSLRFILESGSFDIHHGRQYPADYEGTREALLAAVIRAAGREPILVVELVRLFLEAGSDPNQIVEQRPDGHRTPLLLAIEQRDMALVDLLLKYNVNVHGAAICGFRRTPLQMAAQVGSLEIATLLIQHGAEVNAEASVVGGGTAFQLAATSGNCNVALELLKHGANVHQQPSRYLGRWPLEAAAEHGRMDMISLIWNASQGMISKGVCDRAKELAVKEGHEACKELIEELQEGATGMATLFLG